MPEVRNPSAPNEVHAEKDQVAENKWPREAFAKREYCTKCTVKPYFFMGRNRLGDKKNLLRITQLNKLFNLFNLKNCKEEQPMVRMGILIYISYPKVRSWNFDHDR